MTNDELIDIHIKMFRRFLTVFGRIPLPDFHGQFEELRREHERFIHQSGLPQPTEVALVEEGWLERPGYLSQKGENLLLEALVVNQAG